MSELQGAIDTGTLEEISTILTRLKDLPNFASIILTDFEEDYAEARRAEIAARLKRIKARATAERVLKKCKQTWTAEQIEEATGYKL